MEIVIATIVTAIAVTGLILIGVNSEVVRPHGTRERIVSPVETCIINNDNNSIESCIFTGKDE